VKGWEKATPFLEGEHCFPSPLFVLQVKPMKNTALDQISESYFKSRHLIRACDEILAACLEHDKHLNERLYTENFQRLLVSFVEACEAQFYSALTAYRVKMSGQSALDDFERENMKNG
jgi:hypothetical protein